MRTALVLTALLLIGLGRSGHPDFPNPGHTGGFGEPSCTACHADGPAESNPEALRVAVNPAEDGGTITVRLQWVGMERAGFQLSTRHADGSQAGDLFSQSDRTEIRILGGVQYASHAMPGSYPRGDSAVWSLNWVPPEQGDSVWVHVAANAANGDASPLGDWIFVHEYLIPAN